MKTTLRQIGTVCFVILLFVPQMPTVIFSDHHGEPHVSAQSAAIIDVESGRILWSREGDKPMLIASTTKILTAIVAIEHGDITDNVTVGPNAYGVEGSSLYLQRGEKMSLHHLLYGLMLRSGNDAAVAIAEHVGGSIEGFAFLMNQKAEEIGMTQSNFVNPHGLNADEHYSTAEDMAKLTAYALKNSIFQEIVKTKVKKAPNPNADWDYTWYNKNKMLSMYDGSDGVKTGYTKLAGRCLVSSATRDGRQLAVVTLNASNDWLDHAQMLNYGFKHFDLDMLAEKGQSVVDDSEFVAGRTFRYPLREEERDLVHVETSLYEQESVYYRLGERGYATFYLDEQVIGSVPLVEADSVRLTLPTSASFQASAPGGRETQNRYIDVLQNMIKGLFVWSI